MPEYLHSCQNPDCNHEWEDSYSIKADPPTTCPKCNQQTAKRLISGGSGKGIVEKSFEEFKANLANDVKDIKKRAATDEKYLANLVGESKYQTNVRANEKIKEMNKFFRRK